MARIILLVIIVIIVPLLVYMFFKKYDATIHTHHKKIVILIMIALVFGIMGVFAFGLRQDNNINLDTYQPPKMGENGVIIDAK